MAAARCRWLEGNLLGLQRRIAQDWAFKTKGFQMLRFFLMATGGLFLGAISAQADVEFLCRSITGVRLTVAILDGTDVAEMTLVDTDGSVSRTPMQRVPSTGNGARYEAPNNGPAFYADGEEGTWTYNSLTSFCRIVSVTEPDADPVEEQSPGSGEQPDSLEIPAISFGGNLRAGPGSNYPRVGRLRQDTPVSLINDVGPEVNGFPFWVIRIPNGDLAYHWGGNLCIPGGALPGVRNGAC